MAPTTRTTPASAEGPGAAASDPGAQAPSWLAALWWGFRPLMLALLAALLVRGLIFGAYRIPTPSMEGTLLVGDFVVVSKLQYGARLPQTLRVPFTDLVVTDRTLPYARMPGLSRVRRGDVAVFHYPVEAGVIDQRTHYIKRVVGLPGDTVAVLDKTVQVNGTPSPRPPGLQHRWIVDLVPEADLPQPRLEEVGVSSVQRATQRRSRYILAATTEVAERIEAWPEVAQIRPWVESASAHGRSYRLFPSGAGFSPDQYGPVAVPARGDTLHLTQASWPLYRTLVVDHEGNRVRRPTDSIFEINGAVTDRYVVQQDYYFVLGDNLDDSADSRVWGFVPHDHLVGKALMVYYSWNPETRRPRWSRLLSPVR
ncbi:MAG: signal peptidase I [Bacteroidota bacterium]